MEEATKVEQAPEGVAYMTQIEYKDQLEAYTILIQAKNKEINHITEVLQCLRLEKEPLISIKTNLQEKITQINHFINTASEQTTQLKSKLRYHSEKHIQENIERLEYQLRNNNFKPREEQKILDEIALLRRSVKTLQEYQAKNAENKRYREQRSQFIERRNNNFIRIKSIITQEEKLKKSMAELRNIISINKNALDLLKKNRGVFEKMWQVKRQEQMATRQKVMEEKNRLRKEQIRIRQEEKRKLWAEYEASREPYEDEIELCRILMAYLNAYTSATTPLSSTTTPLSFTTTPLSSTTTPLSLASTPITPSLATTPIMPGTPVATGASTNTLAPSDIPHGIFYSKQKDDAPVGLKRSTSKREKTRAKKDKKLSQKVKDLAHTPDVLEKFSKLKVSPPKTSADVCRVLILLQDKLQNFTVLSQSEIKKRQPQNKAVSLDENQTKENEDESCRTKNKSAARPTSLPIFAVDKPKLDGSWRKSTSETVAVTPVFTPVNHVASVSQSFVLSPTASSWAAAVSGNMNKVHENKVEFVGSHFHEMNLNKSIQGNAVTSSDTMSLQNDIYPNATNSQNDNNNPAFTSVNSEYHSQRTGLSICNLNSSPAVLNSNADHTQSYAAKASKINLLNGEV